MALAPVVNTTKLDYWIRDFSLDKVNIMYFIINFVVFMPGGKAKSGNVVMCLEKYIPYQIIWKHIPFLKEIISFQHGIFPF